MSWGLLGVYGLGFIVLSLWPFDLYLNGVRWVESSRGIEFTRKGQVVSDDSAGDFYKRLTQGSGLSVEVWLSSLSDDQTGPARIVSYSANTTERNFTLGQDEGKLVMRLRTTETDPAGMVPHLEVDKAIDASKIQHIVVTYDFSEQCVYVDGSRKLCTDMPGGDFESWDPSHRLLLGNEATGDRPWLGRLFLVGIFCRPLSEAEIYERYESGWRGRDRVGSEWVKGPQGLVAQYVFDQQGGRRVGDVSASGSQLDLHIPRMVRNFDKRYLEGPHFGAPIDPMEVWVSLLHLVVLIPLGVVLHGTVRTHSGSGWRTSGVVFIALSGFALLIESLQHLCLSRHSRSLDVGFHVFGILVGIWIDRRWAGSQR